MNPFSFKGFFGGKKQVDPQLEADRKRSRAFADQFDKYFPENELSNAYRMLAAILQTGVFMRMSIEQSATFVLATEPPQEVKDNFGPEGMALLKKVAQVILEIETSLGPRYTQDN